MHCGVPVVDITDRVFFDVERGESMFLALLQDQSDQRGISVSVGHDFNG
jgi:hypothetical protein